MALESEDPVLVQQLAQKRSLKVKDPARARNLNGCFPVNELPVKALKSIITPSILKKDQEACLQIIDKLHADEISAEYREQLLMKSRQRTRERFFTQHEKNIDREKSAGVHKSYSKLVINNLAPSEGIATIRSTLMADQTMQEQMQSSRTRKISQLSTIQ